jgi:hypothetical protein
MIKPLSLAKALRIQAGTADQSVVDTFIDWVNASLSTRAKMQQHRCSPEVGEFYQVHLRLTAEPDDCRQIETKFKNAGWKAVKVVYWQGSLGISLEYGHARDWTSVYEGKPLTGGLAQRAA